MIIQIIILLGVAAIIYLLLRDKGLIGAIGGTRKRRIILDSCALIDARIVELVRTNFIADELIIPKFILRELQQLADGNDSHKRERARFGLETAISLQELTQVLIDDTDYARTLPTDDKLMVLSKDRNAVLCTTDYNLNKVASAEGITVLNINDLAQSLRPISLPGERHTIKVVQKGSNKNQGVGYLDDGTMIVVDGGAKYVGKSVQVVMDHMLQTVAGKMAFAKIVSSHNENPESTAQTPQLRRQAPASSRPQVAEKAPVAMNIGRPEPRRTRDQLEQTLLSRLNGTASSPRPRRRPPKQM